MPLIASNLRAGSSVAQAIGPVAENMSDPIKSEFRRLTSDIRAGTPVPEALDKVADRTGSRDLRLFATAVDISQQTGGSLADITENVGQTVRARVEARKTIKSKTSLNRIESQIMVGLPVFRWRHCSRSRPPTASSTASPPAGHLSRWPSFWTRLPTS
ncbi:MAG: type II secretion system F family protein [Paratractidigestivibacter faecalis]